MQPRASSKAYLIVRLLFGIPFIGIGMVAMAVASYRYLTGVTDLTQTALLTIFGLGFCALGAGPALSLRSARKKAEKDALAQAASPDKPWMWRDDWAAGHISSSTRSLTAFAWGFAILWNVVSTPILFVLRNRQEKNYAVLIALLFPAIGLFLLFRAIRLSMEFRKFGVSDFVMSSVPGVVGGKLQGSIYAAFDPRSERSAKVKLTCIHRMVTGTGDDRTVSERIQWQDQRDLGPAEIAPGPTGCIIPVLFHIPVDVPETDIRDMDNAIQWKLDVRADVPGLDYRVRFDVPVFRTSDTSPSPEPQPETIAAPVTSPVRIQAAPSGGTEFIFPAARNPRMAAILAVLLLFWTAWMALFIKLVGSAWVIFPSIILGVIDAFLLLFTLMCFISERIIIERENITIRRSLFGVSWVQQVPRSNVSDLKINIGMQTGGAEGTAYYDIQLVCRDGRNRNAGGQIPNKREAVWLMSQMKQAMGR
ncbi:MAG TPA: hypothetical protein VER98_15450 [Terriglobia bacterium]|nr:hypothetical protein [Terriglobia bacterium]